MSKHNTPGEPGTKSTAEQAKEKSAELTGQAKATAKNIAEDAASAAAGQAESAKGAAADEISNVASALRTAAEEMRSGSPQERTFGQIAEGLADASEAMRNKDLGEMVEDVSAFARNNPLVFLGGAALIGFAAARFAKASDRTTSAYSSTSSPMSAPSAPASNRGTHASTSGDFT